MQDLHRTLHLGENFNYDQQAILVGNNDKGMFNGGLLAEDTKSGSKSLKKNDLGLKKHKYTNDINSDDDIPGDSGSYTGIKQQASAPKFSILKDELDFTPQLNAGNSGGTGEKLSEDDHD